MRSSSTSRKEFKSTSLWLPVVLDLWTISVDLVASEDRGRFWEELYREPSNHKAHNNVTLHHKVRGKNREIDCSINDEKVRHPIDTITIQETKQKQNFFRQSLFLWCMFNTRETIHNSWSWERIIVCFRTLTMPILGRINSWDNAGPQQVIQTQKKNSLIPEIKEPDQAMKKRRMSRNHAWEHYETNLQ